MSATIPSSARQLPWALKPRIPVAERDFFLFLRNENWTPYVKDVQFRNSGAEGASMLTFEARLGGHPCAARGGQGHGQDAR